MKLIWSGTSPFARKCMIVAHELGIAETLEIENGSGTPVEPNALTAAYNPLGKLPCLVPDDGPAIFDSSVICQHLIAHREGQRLLPTEIDPRSRVLTLEALGDGICDAGVLVRYERAVRPENLRWENWIDSQFLKIDRALDALSQRWMPHLSGPLDLGQIAIGCGLGYLDFRYSERGWREAHPVLARWHDGFKERPSVKATNPE